MGNGELLEEQEPREEHEWICILGTYTPEPKRVERAPDLDRQEQGQEIVPVKSQNIGVVFKTLVQKQRAR